MTRDELKRRVLEAVDARAGDIVAIGERIRRHPELGFKESKTARLAEETFARLGLARRAGLALTGVRADLAGQGGAGPTLALLGELDALVVAGHPEADPVTGAAHACGHNWRAEQARAGKLEFLGGKPELLRLGHFDDVDLAMMIHTTARPEDGRAGVPESNNGCIVKTVRCASRPTPPRSSGRRTTGRSVTAPDRRTWAT